MDLTERENQMLEVVQDFINRNRYHNVRIGGSLALKLQGVDLGREPHDIDLIANVRANELSAPDIWNCVSDKRLSQLESTPFKDIFYGFDIDVIESDYYGENTVEIDGFPVDSIENVLKAKVSYICNSMTFDDVKTKHKNDIIQTLKSL